MTVRKISGRVPALFLSAVLALSGCGGAGQNASSAQSGETKSPETSAAAQAENSGTAEAGTEKENGAGTAGTEKETAPNPAVTNLPLVDMTKWQYNADDDVYWQIGIAYCEKPADETYQTMGFFVPGAFFDAEDNGDGTFTCEMNVMQAVGNYTADNAPVILPVNTPGYSAMSAPTGYDSSFGYGSVTDYTQEYWSGFPFPSPGNLPYPGIEPRSPTLCADALPSGPPGKPLRLSYCLINPHSAFLISLSCL